jgi:dihydrofolate synthase/folylpolyglutamate synthase
MPSSDQLLGEMRTLHPRRIDLSLERIGRLLARLGDPQRRLAPVIHIAGTNGKGSTAAYLKAMLEAAGKRVHVYTSPHLVRFHERIALAGEDGKSRPIGEAELVARLSEVKRVNAGDTMTFFEITTAAALQAFAEHPADAVILEVGLGGRLDTTNVVASPALCVITPISMDHADWFGASIPLITREKAGILKRGVAAVIAQQPEDAEREIAARAAAVGAPIVLWGRDYEAFEQRGRLVHQSEGRLLDLPLPALIGPHQIINAGVAVTAALHLAPRGLFSLPAIERGLAEVCWPARMQRLQGGPLARLLVHGSELWLDGGHNPAAAQAIAQTLADLEERAPKPVSLVVGMGGQKDAGGFFAHFRGLVRRVVTVPIPDTAAHEAPALAAIATAAGLAAEPADDVVSALKRLHGAAPERILICGSLYLAGHVLATQEGVRAQLNERTNR